MTPGRLLSPAATGADRFELLLPLRGLIALAIVLHHVAGLDMGLSQARVVLFFLISGHCVFSSADWAIARVERATTWIRRRIMRIWPAYVLALLYLLCVFGLRDEARPGLRMVQSAAGWIANVLLVQWVWTVRSPVSAACQNPMLLVPTHWTLGYEVQFYVLMALGIVAAKMGRIRLGWIALALGCIGACMNFATPYSDRGILFDYGIHFALGAAVYYRGRSDGAHLGRRTLIDGAIGLTLLASLAMLVLRVPPSLGGRDAIGEMAVSSACAVGLVLVRRWDDRIAGWGVLWPLRAIGRISYPLFLVHAINMTMARDLALGTLPAGSPRWLLTSAAIGWHIALAGAFWWVCEGSLLRNLRRAGSEALGLQSSSDTDLGPSLPATRSM